jgi:RNA polymerase sigma-70 factor (ECF subfamily)
MAAVVSVDNRAVRLTNPEVFRAFYEETLPGICGYFLHRCGGVEAVAEDLTQETYLAAVRELQRGREVDSPAYWLYGIARHKLLDYYRLKGKIQRLDVPWHEEELDDIPIPLLDLESAADRDLVTIALDQLPESQKTVLVLRYMDGLSVPEVAVTTGKSVHAVESLLARGRASMKRILTEVRHV